jgi:hypothetical protein
VSCPTFDGSGGSGGAIGLPLRPPRTAPGPAQLAADVTVAATATPAPLGTVMATGQATYAAPGHGTLALPLTAMGRSILEQVKAADASYYTAHPGGTTPPFVWLKLTLTFAPAATVAAASGGAPLVLIVVIVVVVLAGLSATAFLLRRRRAATQNHNGRART